MALIAMPEALGLSGGGLQLLCYCALLALLLVVVHSARLLARARRAEQEVTAILDAIPAPALLFREAGRVVTSNRMGLDLLGPVQPGPVSGWSRRLGFLLGDGQTPCPLAAFPPWAASRGRRPPPRRLLLRNASCPRGSWFQVSATPIGPGAALVVMRGDSGPLEVGRRLRRLTRAAEMVSDSIYAVDERGRITYANQALVRLAGRSRFDLIGRKPADVLPRSSRSRRARPESLEHDRRLQGGKVWPFRASSGAERMLLETVAPIRDGEGRISESISVLRDVSERFANRRLALECRRLEQDVAACDGLRARWQPHAYTAGGRVDVAWAMPPAASASGHYLDCLEGPAGQVVLLLGDVHGEGVEAELLVAEVRASVRSLLGKGEASMTLPAALSELLGPDLGEDGFIRLMVAELDPVTSLLTYSLSGNLPSFVLGATGTVRARLTMTSLALGIGEHVDSESPRRYQLQGGESALFLTGDLPPRQPAARRGCGTLHALESLGPRGDEPAWKIVHGLRSYEDPGADGDCGDGPSILCVRVPLPRDSQYTERLPPVGRPGMETR